MAEMQVGGGGVVATVDAQRPAGAVALFEPLAQFLFHVGVGLRVAEIDPSHEDLHLLVNWWKVRHDFFSLAGIFAFHEKITRDRLVYALERVCANPACRISYCVHRQCAPLVSCAPTVRAACIMCTGSALTYSASAAETTRPLPLTSKFQVEPGVHSW